LVGCEAGPSAGGCLREMDGEIGAPVVTAESARAGLLAVEEELWEDLGGL
jgi:hypothetical protein